MTISWGCVLTGTVSWRCSGFWQWFSLLHAGNEFAPQSTRKENVDGDRLKGQVVSVFIWAPCHEGVWRDGCTDPRFLGVGTSWRRVVTFMPLPLYKGEKNPRYPLNSRHIETDEGKTDGTNMHAYSVPATKQKTRRVEAPFHHLKAYSFLRTLVCHTCWHLIREIMYWLKIRWSIQLWWFQC
jgi:hypothetical protein